MKKLIEAQTGKSVAKMKKRGEKHYEESEEIVAVENT
jgi:hypothetical protein